MLQKDDFNTRTSHEGGEITYLATLPVQTVNRISEDKAVSNLQRMIYDTPSELLTQCLAMLEFVSPWEVRSDRISNLKAEINKYFKKSGN